jgi:hypothetical protein
VKKTFVALALTLAAAVAAPAMAEDEAPQKVQFSYEGVTYTYTKTQVGKSTVYKGYASPGDEFYLVARNGRVTGRANGINVSFRTPTVDVQEAMAKQNQVASR